MAKRKYSGVVETLPRLGIDPQRGAILEAVKDEILAPSRGDAIEMIDVDERDALLRVASMGVRDALNALKRSTVGKPRATEFARAYAEARDMKDAIDALAADANLIIEAFQALMVDAMDLEGVEAVKLAGGRSVSTYPEPYAQVVDKELFRRWCVENGLSAKMALPWQSTNMIVKDRLLTGEPEPPGVTAWSRTVVRLDGKPESRRAGGRSENEPF